MQREAASRGETIERLAASVARGSGVVLALVEEDARFLSMQQVCIKLQPVDAHRHERWNLSVRDHRLERELLFAADRYIIPENDPFRREKVYQTGHDRFLGPI